MSVEKFIAKRYLISRHKISFITIISFLSITGITIGVAALIVVLSVFNGFGSLVTSFLMNLDPDIRIEFVTESNADDANKFRLLLEEDENILQYSEFVSGKILALHEQKNEVINLRGIDITKLNSMYNLDELTYYGKPDLKQDEKTPGIIVGIRLADRLQSLIGDTISLISPSGIERAITQFSLPNTQKFIVRGIFNSQNNEYDASLAIISVNEAQYLLGYNENVQGFEIKLKDNERTESYKEELAKFIDPAVATVSGWYDFHKDLYSVMQIERWVAYILLSLIIAVATFNILGSLSMSVLEKKKDIGILKSMGAKENSILKIFLNEGFLIGLIGTLAGVMLGYLICYFQITVNIYPLDPTQYKIDRLPVELRFSDFFFVAGASMLLSFLAALFPARKASKVDALEAIKWE